MRASFWRQLAVCCALILIAGFAWSQRTAISQALGISDGAVAIEKRKRDRSTPVIVAEAESAQDDLSLEVVGTGRAKRSVMLRAEVAGRVADAPILEQTSFKKDDVLLSLDSRMEEVEVSLARTRLADAERNRQRFDRLRSRGAMAAARVDDARTAARLSKLELDQAREQLDDRRVLAPFDGVVGLTDIEAGAWIDSGDSIATFDDRSEIIVQFDLPEALVPRVSIGDAVTATTPSAGDRRFSGVVRSIDSRIDAASRSIGVRVAILNADDALRPGASFTVRLELPGGTYTKVPELALQFSRASSFVWRVRDGKAVLAEVRLVRRLDGAALVDGDIAPGDVVVIEGAQRLAPGRTVRVMRTPGV